MTTTKEMTRKEQGIANTSEHDVQAPRETEQIREVRLEPAADVFRDESGVRVLVDVPGVTEKGLEVSLHDGVLSIEGRAPRGENLERVYSRSFRVDRRIDAEAIEARVSQGVLTLRLPFREEAQPRRIAVKTD